MSCVCVCAREMLKPDCALPTPCCCAQPLSLLCPGLPHSRVCPCRFDSKAHSEVQEYKA